MLFRRAIEREYLEHGSIIFWPRQFFEEGVREDDVIQALGQLVRDGMLADEAVLHCSDGTEAFTCTPAEVADWLERGECHYCDTDPEVPHAIEMRFTMTPSCREHLEDLRDLAQKKTSE